MKLAVCTILAVLLVGTRCAPAAQETTPVNAYADTKDGLETFLNELFAAIKSNDRKQVSALIKDTEIPNDRQWFLSMYDQEKAESWIEPYEKDLPQREREFQQLLEGLAKTDGQLVLRKVNDDPEPGKGMEWGMLHSAKAPLDIYFAAWKTEANQNGRPVAIGYFYFIDGKFRWDSLILVFSAPLNKPATPPAIVLQNSTVSVPAGKPREGVLPPKVLQSVPAQYTDTARLARLEGTVLLSTIIDTLGRPQNIKVVRSLGEGLDEKAVDALRLWTFSPATRDGKPFPSQAEIEIRFKLYDKK